MSHSAPTLLRTVLLIEDDEEFRKVVRKTLNQVGFSVKEAATIQEAEACLSRDTKEIDLVLSDIHLPDRNAILFLASQSVRGLRKHPWVFMSGDPSPELLQNVLNAGGSDLIQKPFPRSELIQTIRRTFEGEQDSTRHAMRIIEQLTGIQLPEEKRLLFQTRLNHRVRALGLKTADEYLAYFRDHRAAELPELISVASTHTTHFFREKEHFDLLGHTFFEKILAEKGHVKIWSAAASTGQEIYTLAICAVEYLKKSRRLLPPKEYFTILGTDIDFRSLEVARNGVYSKQEVSSLPPLFLENYFDEGTGALAGLFRAKDILHQLVRFEQMNLLSLRNVGFTPDIVFLRNVLMYFKPETAIEILRKLVSILPEGTPIFIGMSESSLGLNAGLEPIGRGAYLKRTRQK